MAARQRALDRGCRGPRPSQPRDQSLHRSNKRPEDIFSTQHAARSTARTSSEHSADRRTTVGCRLSPSRHEFRERASPRHGGPRSHIVSRLWSCKGCTCCGSPLEIARSMWTRSAGCRLADAGKWCTVDLSRAHTTRSPTTPDSPADGLEETGWPTELLDRPSNALWLGGEGMRG